MTIQNWYEIDRMEKESGKGFLSAALISAIMAVLYGTSVKDASEEYNVQPQEIIEKIPKQATPQWSEEDVRKVFDPSHDEYQGNQDNQDNATSISEDGKNLIKQFESLKLKPYDDQTGQPINQWVKGATIGWGHLISQQEWNKYKNGINQQQADHLLDNDLERFINVVNQSITVNLSQNQFDALVSLAYNIGVGNFQSSSLVKLINDSNSQTKYTSVEDAWKAWNKSQGKVMRGLENRRSIEYNYFTK